MAANINAIFPVAPYVAFASLKEVSPCTTRVPTVTAGLAANNIIALTAASTNGLRIDKIQVQACSSSLVSPCNTQLVTIWLWDATTAWPIDEITVTATTPSATSPAFNNYKLYQNLVIPATNVLYVSNTTQTNSNTTALCVSAYGGIY